MFSVFLVFDSPPKSTKFQPTVNEIVKPEVFVCRGIGHGIPIQIRPARNFWMHVIQTKLF